MSLNQEISNFLRDSQYRFAELTVNKDAREDTGDIAIRSEISIRRQLDAFLFLLYTNRYDIITPEQGDWPNFLYDKWTDDEIITEMDYLRELSEMNLIPWLDFTASVNVIRQEVTEIVIQEIDGIRQSSIGDLPVYINEFEVAGLPKEQVVNFPVKFESEWQGENPSLFQGYVAFSKDDISGKITKMVVGPGPYNTLTNLFDSFEYSGIATATSTFGGITKGDDLSQYTIQQLFELILTSFQVPVISNVQTNAGGGGNDITLEIGDSIANLSVSYDITDPDNLVATTPINVTTSENASNNEGDFDNGAILLTFPGDNYSPNVITELEITVKGTHQQAGETNTASAFVRWYPRVISGTSQTATITSTQVLTLADKQETVVNTPIGDYEFSRAGYHWICFPSMINPGNLIFLDKSQGNSITVPMTLVNTLSVTVNGVALPYILYRTTYYQNEPFSIRTTL